MTKAEIYAELERIMKVQPGTISGDETIERIGVWDSLAIVEFIAFADGLDLSINPESVDRCATIPDLLALLGNKVTG
jgi:acyl carrier protein